MILFVNACVREDSRTKRLADRLLQKLGHYTEVDLNEEHISPLDRETLDLRTKWIDAGDFNHSLFDYAKQFASADTIVIAAPYWDYSFPAILKNYLESIYITGIVSRYGNDGHPIGLCKATELYYVTTAGGPYTPDYSYDYLRRLAVDCFGIKETYLIRAEMLDVYGSDPEAILAAAEDGIDRLLARKTVF